MVDDLPLDAHTATLRAVRRRTGMIFQQFNLVGRLTVSQLNDEAATS